MTDHRFLRLLVVALCIGTLVACSTQAWGTIWEKHKDCAEYGHIDQHLLSDAQNNWLGAVACAPTATMNSFIYLQNHYPTVYDHLLVPEGAGQDVIKARELALNWMNTTLAGTTTEDWVWGKYNFLENYAPGKTIYHGQTMYNGWTALLPRPLWVDAALPDWSFLFNELNKCQDVEIGINWGSDMGHALTVCGFLWDDQTSTGKIWYVDPWVGACTPLNAGIPIWIRMDGKLGFNYSGANAYVDMALAESVPEPGSLMVLATGLAGIVGIVVRRRR